MAEDTKVELQVIRPINTTVNCTIPVDWPIGHKTWADLQYIANIGKMYGILHPENNKYRMNVPCYMFCTNKSF